MSTLLEQKCPCCGGAIEFNANTQNMKCPYCDAEFDIAAMQQAADALLGEHDFTSFCSAKTEKENKVRTLYDFTVRREGQDVVIRVTGSGFLYNMVRILAGTLMKVGQGAIKPEQIPGILEAMDRTKAGPTLPPEGLTLVEIKYL